MYSIQECRLLVHLLPIPRFLIYTIKIHLSIATTTFVGKNYFIISYPAFTIFSNNWRAPSVFSPQELI
jgi:hypothetical protein